MIKPTFYFLRSVLFWVFLAVVFLAGAGMIGMWKTKKLEAGECTATYRRYFVAPVLKEFLECREGKRPCGFEVRESTENEAHRKMARCLCANPGREPAAERYFKDSYCARCRSFDNCPECRAGSAAEICRRLPSPKL